MISNFGGSQFDTGLLDLFIVSSDGNENKAFLFYDCFESTSEDVLHAEKVYDFPTLESKIFVYQIGYDGDFDLFFQSEGKWIIWFNEYDDGFAPEQAERIAVMVKPVDIVRPTGITSAGSRSNHPIIVPVESVPGSDLVAVAYGQNEDLIVQYDDPIRFEVHNKHLLGNTAKIFGYLNNHYSSVYRAYLALGPNSIEESMKNSSFHFYRFDLDTLETELVHVFDKRVEDNSFYRFNGVGHFSGISSEGFLFSSYRVGNDPEPGNRSIGAVYSFIGIRPFRNSLDRENEVVLSDQAEGVAFPRISPIAQRFISVGQNNLIQEFDVVQRWEKFYFGSKATYSSNGFYLAIGVENSVHLINQRNNTVENSYVFDEDEIVDMDFSEQGDKLVVGTRSSNGGDHSVYVLDLRSDSVLDSIQVDAYSSVFHLNDSVILIGGNGYIGAWDRSIDQFSKLYEGEFSGTGKFAISRKKDFILTDSLDTTSPVLFHIESEDIVLRYDVDIDKVSALAFSSDDEYALFGMKNGDFEIYRAQTGEFINTVHAHEGAIRSIDCSINGVYVLTVDGSAVKLWLTSYDIDAYERDDTVVEDWSMR